MLCAGTEKTIFQKVSNLVEPRPKTKLTFLTSPFRNHMHEKAAIVFSMMGKKIGNCNVDIFYQNSSFFSDTFLFSIFHDDDRFVLRSS